MTTPHPWLTDAEVDDLCCGLTRNAAKARWLRGLGLTVNLKPDGRPLVIRSHAERVLSGIKAAAGDEAEPATEQRPQPNMGALVQLFGRAA